MVDNQDDLRLVSIKGVRLFVKANGFRTGKGLAYECNEMLKRRLLEAIRYCEAADRRVVVPGDL